MSRALPMSCLTRTMAQGMPVPQAPEDIRGIVRTAKVVCKRSFPMR